MFDRWGSTGLAAGVAGQAAQVVDNNDTFTTALSAAGLILAGTFAAPALAPVSFLQQIGFSVATGILLSTFVMSMFLVPALTAFIGLAAWWPGHGDVD